MAVGQPAVTVAVDRGNALRAIVVTRKAKNEVPGELVVDAAGFEAGFRPDFGARGRRQQGIPLSLFAKGITSNGSTRMICLSLTRSKNKYES